MGVSRLAVTVLLVALCLAGHLVWGQGLVNVALQKPSYASSTYSGSPANVVDGDNGTNSWLRTYTSTNPYWEVNLGRKYPVYEIIIWSYRVNDTYLFPFNITVDSQHCVNVSSNTGNDRNISVTCPSVLYGQTVRVSRTGYNRDLRLCEVEVLACSPGFWGTHCDRTCYSALCLDNTCSPKTGACIECAKNFQEPTCLNCSSGYYKSRDVCYPCSGLCHNAQCDPNNGTCSNCRSGYYKSRDVCYPCSSLCDDARCDPNNGTCSKCKAGYFKRGNGCFPCSSLCGNASCDPDTGYCNACLPGRWGDYCQHSCPASCEQRTCDRHNGSCYECVEGFYRLSPSPAECRPCPWRCGEDTACNKTTGQCPSCPPGWEGPTCLQAVKDEGLEKLAVPVVGAIIGAALLIIIAVVAIQCWKHRSHTKARESDTTNALVTDPVPAQNNVYTGEPSAIPSTSGEAAHDDSRHVIRDPANTYEQLRVYSNMVFDAKAHPEPEPRDTDVTASQSTSEYFNVSLEHVYVNTKASPQKKKKAS